MGNALLVASILAADIRDKVNGLLTASTRWDAHHIPISSAEFTDLMGRLDAIVADLDALAGDNR